MGQASSLPFTRLELAGFPQPNAAYIAFFMILMWLVGKLFITGKYQ